MKSYQEPRDWKICPKCENAYSFLRPRISYWEGGARKEECLDCGVIRERHSDRIVREPIVLPTTIPLSNW